MVLVREGQIAIIKQNLYYDEQYGGLVTSDERDYEHKTWLYLKKGVKMKADESGDANDVMWSGGGHNTTLSFPVWAILKNKATKLKDNSMGGVF